MKRLTALLTALLLMLPMAAPAEMIDFSVYTLEELLQLQAALDQAITDKMRETVATPVTDFIWADNGVEVMLRSYTGTAAEVVIPAEVNGLPVTQIGDSAFHENTAITSVVIPEGVTLIGQSAFHGCSRLETVVLPRSLDSIGINAFRDCRSLHSINLEHVPNFGNMCFTNCDALTGVLRFYAPQLSMKGTFYDCDGITGIEIYSTQVTIDGNFLYRADSIEYIYVAADARLLLRSYPISDNKHLETVVFPAATSYEGSSKLFDNCPLVTVYTPAGTWLESYARENFIPCNTTDYETMNAMYALHAE